MTSTKMIRSFEKTNPEQVLSRRARRNGRMPIIAVSASLVESNVEVYKEAGFDGWILKPISFVRLAELMKGIVDDKSRAHNVYQPGKWEQGGWFYKAQPDRFVAKTTPSGGAPVT